MSGYDNGDIKMFDLRMMCLRWETNVKSGVMSTDKRDDILFCLYVQVCSVQFDRKDIPMNKMVATTLESKFHVYDLRTHHPQKGFTSLAEKVQGIRFENF